MKDFQNNNSEGNKKDDFIFGLRPVMEALEAGKTIDKIFLQNALQGEIYHELKNPKYVKQHLSELEHVGFKLNP